MDKQAILSQRSYYEPPEGDFCCKQDPEETINANFMKELPGSRQHPIYHEPGSITGRFEETVPNSFLTRWKASGEITTSR